MTDKEVTVTVLPLPLSEESFRAIRETEEALHMVREKIVKSYHMAQFSKTSDEA